MILLVLAYLGAIVAANLVSTIWGAGASILNAFILIGLDLSCRDRLHEMWQGHLVRNMAGLIAAGSLLSWGVNRDAGQIAVASFAAFALAATADTLVYQRLAGHPRLTKMNGSNVFSAAVDSIAFPALAWGFPLLVPVMAGQFLAKVGGGFLWSLVLARR